MPPRLFASGARGVTIFLACFALWWSASSLRAFWLSSSLEIIAQKVLNGDGLNEDALTRASLRFERLPIFPITNALDIRSWAILKLRLLDSAIARADPADIDRRSDDLLRSLRSTLATSPSDPFAWFVIFWLQNNRTGFNSSHLKYLQRSYDLGPREQWIAERRNRVAMTVFSQVTPSVQASIVEEFAGLVNVGLTAEAASILAGPGWLVRDRILSGLSKVDITKKVALIRFLSRRGYRISIPDVPEQEERPW